jgi:zinc metalloprotease ZmpB
VTRSFRRASVALLALALVAIVPAAATAKQPAGCTSGTALVFFTNPVVTSGDTTLTDRKDQDYPALNNERVEVPLIGLDGSGYLRGTWAVVQSATGDEAYETDCTYEYTRHDDRFEQVMAYYWTTKSQLYTRGLGFGVNAGWPAINGDAQRVRINQWGVDNSFATTHPRDEMRFGKGGVDDAEDAEVILHELGHQIHFSQSETFFASIEAGSISEGFGDYWAATVSEWAMAQAGITPQTDPACIADWDAVSYSPEDPPCLRRLDRTLKYTGEITSSIHRNGQIWSHALWNLRTAIGRAHADTAILWAQFDWTGTTMPELAQRIVDEVDDRYGATEAALAVAAFADRDILEP